MNTVQTAIASLAMVGVVTSIIFLACVLVIAATRRHIDRLKISARIGEVLKK